MISDSETHPNRPAPPPSPRRLRRSNDRQIAGVAGGVAEYFEIDPVIARLGFVVALFAGGAGLIAYLVAWAVLPEATGVAAPSNERPLDRRTTVTVLALVVAAWIAISDPFQADVIVPLILVAVGVYLLRQREGGFGETSVPATVAPTSAEDVVAAETADADPDFAWSSPVADELQPPPRPRRPAVVTRVCLSALALLFAGAITTRQVDWVQADTSSVIAIGLVMVGIAALVGSFVGRSRGIVVVGVLLSLAFAAAGVIEPVVEDGVGDRLFRPTTIDTGTASYNLGIGDMVVDLRDLEIQAGSETRVSIKMGIGHTVVHLPPDVDVRVEGDLDIGELIILGEFESGLGNELVVERDVDGDALLIVNLEMGIGQAEVLGE